MARLTDGMTRLVGEIHSDHVGRKHATIELKRSMAQTVAHLHRARLAHTKEQQKHLREFAVALKHSVDGMRAAFAADVAGAHAAWFGGSKAGSRANVGRAAAMPERPMPAAPERARARA